jgi:hypothetical protein
MNDPARFDYTDEAIVNDKRTVDVLLTATRSSGQAEIRRQHREDAQENAAA